MALHSHTDGGGATSEPLVPKGLPQGERQKVRENMVRAGVPLAPPQSGGTQSSATTLPSSGGGGGPLDLLSGSDPSQFPFLADAPADQVSAEHPQSVTQALAVSAQSDFARAVSARLARSGT